MLKSTLHLNHLHPFLPGCLLAFPQDPARFVTPDPEMAATLLDQKEAGKMLLLITNSDAEYTDRLMTFAYERFLPSGMAWRDLFDMVRSSKGLEVRAAGSRSLCGCVCVCV